MSPRCEVLTDWSADDEAFVADALERPELRRLPSGCGGEDRRVQRGKGDAVEDEPGPVGEPPPP